MNKSVESNWKFMLYREVKGYDSTNQVHQCQKQVTQDVVVVDLIVLRHSLRFEGA